MRIAYAALAMIGVGGFSMFFNPPVKMGLWEVTSISTSQATGRMVDALKQSGQAIGTPNKTTIKLCVTPETWEKSLGGNAPTRPGCTRTDVVHTSDMIAGKQTCTFGQNVTSADEKAYFDSSEKMHGTMHLTMKSAMGTMETEGTTVARFLGSDCGDVKPLTEIHRP